MTNGEQITGTRDEHYDIVSVLYHALEAGWTYETYIRDAEQRGDNELADFFRGCQEEDRRRAEQAKALIAKRVA